MVTYLDSGDLFQIRGLWGQVSGFTTNPSLMKASGITNYREFAKLAHASSIEKPISFEVTTGEVYEQAHWLSSLGDNVFVKVPVTNDVLIKKLSSENVKINVTAVMTLDQIRSVTRWLNPKVPAVLSIFCGRIADTGRDPIPFITEALRVKHATTKVLWASTRELLNMKQAQAAGTDIITVSPELLRKTYLFGKDLLQYSYETVKQFEDDSKGINW